MFAMLNGIRSKIKQIETRHFQINHDGKKYTVEWRPVVLDAIKAPRYIGWFSGIDIVRLNAETILNALCNEKTDYQLVADYATKSVNDDFRSNHIVNQCFWEIGL